tara:strand:+ start:531 stop:872 length:342 start_codon:yes stop_codon:yes gene_type:complete
MKYHPDWITQADLEYYTAAKGKVFEVLAKRAGRFVPVALIERATGTLRVAARIDAIRDDWDVETKRGDDNRAMYRLNGRQRERVVRPHCKTCMCNPVRESAIPMGQLEFGLEA